MSPFPTDSYFPPQYHNGTNQENPSLSCINTGQMLSVTTINLEVIRSSGETTVVKIGFKLVT